MLRDPRTAQIIHTTPSYVADRQAHVCIAKCYHMKRHPTTCHDMCRLGKAGCIFDVNSGYYDMLRQLTACVDASVISGLERYFRKFTEKIVRQNQCNFTLCTQSRRHPRANRGCIRAATSLRNRHQPTLGQSLHLDPSTAHPCNEGGNGRQPHTVQEDASLRRCVDRPFGENRGRTPTLFHQWPHSKLFVTLL